MPDISQPAAPSKLALLKEALLEVGVDRDIPMVATAQELMALVDPSGAQQGKYVVVHNSKNVVVGDHNIQIVHPLYPYILP